jgi:hypothetical protein
MSGGEKIALDLALVLLIIVLVWARWQRYWDVHYTNVPDFNINE